ncbi:hypothetical protein P343_09870 [Sporolactobacillus laevolacticus DSM 442]|uniref:Uncharacterized protein n=1 Tax=Sporolactobacillus laevolacticus DSM 442 TaxID=1395513 RepID=V6J5I5_9BACL|nr:hypothetical protein P343_09870 [Sporolactobacillus laevolacticus DSM 442]
MEKIYNIYRALLGEFNNDTQNQNLTFAVTITAGLLTVSALVTIFISLNKQHLIQKCKELSWQMEWLTISMIDKKCTYVRTIILRP